MNVRFTLVCLVAASISANSAAVDVPSTLALLKSSYESNLLAIVRSDATAECMAIYGKKLDSLAETLQNAGDLDGVVAMRAEKKRLDEEKKVPAESSPDINSAIAKARAEYQQSATKAETDKNRGILALADNYASNLESLKKQFTQQDKIEEATLVKHEIERLHTSAEVTAAQFVIADLASKQPQATTVQPKAVPVQPAETATLKPAKYMRRIYCKGDSDHGWTKTIQSVSKGDTVTITAKGEWKCIGFDNACGPEGYPGEGTGAFTKSHPVRRYNRHGSYIVQQNETVRYGRNRYLQRKPYGALVCKVGEEGQVKVVGESLSFTVVEEGPIYLDSNVAPGSTARTGCSGSMTVSVDIQKASP